MGRERDDMVIRVSYPDGRRLRAEFRDRFVETDLPGSPGAEGSTPSPYPLFLAALGMCSASMVFNFCRRKNLPTEGLSLSLRAEHARGERLARVLIEIEPPEGFPGKYLAALTRAAASCSVKKAIEAAPAFEIRIASQ